MLSSANTVELRDNPAKLQTQPCGSAAEQETVQQEATDSDNSQTLTQFALHGVLQATPDEPPQCTSTDTSVMLIPEFSMVVFYAHPFDMI
jgi:hypothetical protein